MLDQREAEVRKGAHCAWRIDYHIVFPVKYRKALLDDEVTAILREAATEIAERFPIERGARGTDKDHLHLLCSAHPKIAQGQSVQVFKRITARDIFRRKPVVKRVLWGGELLTDAYYVAMGGARANWQTIER
ncbi:MAG: IS200/IS605 family transposase [Nitrospira sp.]|nr:IS200/IS605 family transposase [Nitrospira sp.]